MFKFILLVYMEIQYNRLIDNEFFLLYTINIPNNYINYEHIGWECSDEEI